MSIRAKKRQKVEADDERSAFEEVVSGISSRKDVQDIQPAITMWHPSNTSPIKSSIADRCGSGHGLEIILHCSLSMMTYLRPLRTRPSR